MSPGPPADLDGRPGGRDAFQRLRLASRFVELINNATVLKAKIVVSA
jgi:hypothetical protein